MVSAQIKDAIEQVLQSELRPWGYRNAEIFDRTDHYGDPAIFIVATFDNPARLPPSEATTNAMVALLDEVRSRGDERIPYLDYVYPQHPTEDEAA